VRTIILFGHQCTAQAAYEVVDAGLRKLQARDIVLAQTTHVDQATGRMLREAGGELWYCGPCLRPPDGAWSPLSADRYLVAMELSALARQATAALTDFMSRDRDSGELT
jgi:hypothetical protein